MAAGGRNIKGITVEIGGDTTKLQSALQGVNKEIKNTESQLKDVNKLLKLDPGNTELIAQKQRLLAEAVQETKTKLNTLKTAAEQAEQALKDGAITQEQYDGLQREIAETELKLKDLEKQANGASAALESIGAKGEAVKKAGEKVTEVGKSLTKNVTTPIVAIGAASVAAFNDVDAGMDIVVTKTGATGEALNGLQESFKNVYGSMPVTAEAAGEAIGEVSTRFKLTGQSLEEVTSVFLQFAEINGTDVSTSIDNVDSIMKKYGIDISHTSEVLGLMTSASQSTGLSMDTLENILSTNGATLKAMGFDLGESINLLAQMEINGVDVSTAMTGMKKAVANATKEGKTGQQALEDTINSIKNATTYTGALSIATELFGAKGAPEMTQAIREGRISVDDLSASLSDYGGVVQTTFENTQDPPDQMKVAFNNLKLAGAELATSLFTVLGPAITELSNMMRGLKEWFSGLSPSTQQLIVKIALLAATIGPALIVIGKIITAVGTIMTILPKLGMLLGVVKGAFASLGAVLMANPIVLIIAGIVALVAAFIYLWNNCEEFRQFWIDLWDNIKQGAEIVWNALKDFFTQAWEGVKMTAELIWNGIKDFFTGLWEGIQLIFTTAWEIITTALTTAWDFITTTVDTVWTGIKDFFTSIWDGIQLVFTSVLETIKTVLSTAWDGIKSTVESVWNGIKSFFTNIWDGIKSTFTTVTGTIKQTVTSVFNNIKNTISTVFNTVKNSISQIWQNINSAISGAVGKVWDTITGKFNEVKNFIVNLATEAWNWGKDFIDGLVGGIKSGIGAIGDAASSIGDKVKSFLHFSRPDEGPLHDYESWMPDFVSGLAKGIERSRGMIQNAVRSLSADMIVSPTVMAAQGAEANNGAGTADLINGLRQAMVSALAGNNNAAGDIVIPVYVGGDMIDEVVVTAQQRMNLKSGGR